MRRPLRPSWITACSDPKETLSPCSSSSESIDLNNVICLTASRRVHGAEVSENGYVQGAGDDSEGWSQGLTPALYWQHQDELLGLVSEQEAIPFIENLVREGSGREQVDSKEPVEIRGTHLWVGRFKDIDAKSRPNWDAVITCQASTKTAAHDANEEDVQRSRTLYLNTGTGKLGARALRNQLPSVVSFLQPVYSKSTQSRPSVLIACSDGTDISIGIALAILCMFLDLKGEFSPFSLPAHEGPKTKTSLNRHTYSKSAGAANHRQATHPAQAFPDRNLPPFSKSIACYLAKCTCIPHASEMRVTKNWHLSFPLTVMKEFE